ncbi:TDT family transporter [Alkaliphilus peptidifermentans]|uniref:Exfoliative toxin A/B n=1 Tax=Alkaliphilus peptidifermentans DSM 18978 TaxID=1120976 RepID=A0A1G5F577_9FIRM|nr:TDT family transporter [Alkaliphilus peptidifermentans]SCY33778.1 exfoliative toxin A/B [Alkaliphilus peptidifermentans DSM 18978]
MDKVIKKIPIPMAGLMLALATTGNLVLSYGSIYRNIFGVISAIILLLILIKLANNPNALVEGFENPVVASVTPTLTMGVMILSTYLKPYLPTIAYMIWLLGLTLHALLIIYFTKKYILSFNIKKVFPSYFVVYVGIVVGSVTAPVYGLSNWGQILFWFGFVSYLILLPLVLYRVFSVKEIPEAALPTIIIFAAPASLCLAGYLNSFQEKNIYIVGFLAILSLLMVTSSIFYMLKLFKLKFYPSYSAFTFPFVISAVAIKATNGFLVTSNRGIASLFYVVKFLELWSITMVLYVLVRYIMFLMPEKDVVLKEKSTPLL